MSYNNDYSSRNDDFRRNQESSNEYGSERREYGNNQPGFERREYGSNDNGIRTEAGRNAQGHFNNAAEDVGHAFAAFDQGGGRQAFESVGSSSANRNENEGERVNPFLKPAQELAAATQEGLKGLPGAILEFATGQYEAHKVHPEGGRPGHNTNEERRNDY